MANDAVRPTVGGAGQEPPHSVSREDAQTIAIDLHRAYWREKGRVLRLEGALGEILNIHEGCTRDECSAWDEVQIARAALAPSNVGRADSDAAARSPQGISGP